MGAPPWLGNTSQTRDDANGFYDRSLGTITNDVPGDKPYQLQAADGAAGDRDGNLATLYDAAGNLTRLNLVRNGPCLGGQCSQRFAYSWDEVGRLVRARRWDLDAGAVGGPGDPLPAGTPTADLRYAYDAGDQRVIKTAHDGSEESHTLYVFETLEVRRAGWDAGAGDYELSRWTEVVYLFANGVRLARVVWHEATELPTAGNQPVTGQHVLLELGDHLGSTSVVLDLATGELVERSTFYAYGATENDYRPGRWKGFREDYRFTGKEEDVEVGLTYFGKRYLNPLLGRWVSPDPLAVHSPGEADWNLYAYVRGQVLRNVDPLGLQEQSLWERAKSTASEIATGAAEAVTQKVGETVEGVKQTVRTASEAVEAATSGEFVEAAKKAYQVSKALGIGTGAIESIGAQVKRTGEALGEAAHAATSGAPPREFARKLVGSHLEAQDLGAQLAPVAVAAEAAVAGVPKPPPRAAPTPAPVGPRKPGAAVPKPEPGTPTQPAIQAKAPPSAPRSKVPKSTSVETIGGKYTKTTKVKPGKGPGQSRAEYVVVKNPEGKTVRTYKDSFDRAGKWQHRKPLRGGPEGRPQGG